jgi:phenylpropionate dioxygenase-like ring-hydroxylating dioxygenase large terminal subunit
MARLPADSWDRLRRGLARVEPPFDSSDTLPPVCYTDPDIYERELESVFRTSWIGVGRADRWKAPGDYAAFKLAGIPIIVLRGKEGELRAFANSCRHRGTQLLEGEGNCRRIICPFHSWTYALDGRLIGAPKMEHTRDFDETDYGLVTVRAATCDGFAFVCFDEATPGLDEWLGDFSDLHRPWSLAGLVSTRRREFDVACNWKLFLEVFNEYYHLPYVHPKSLNGIYDLPDEADEIAGNYATQFGTTRGTGGLLENTQDEPFPTIETLRDRNRQGTRYSWTFPNMTFAAGTEAIWVYEAYPLAPDRTRVGMTLCFPAATVARPDFEARAQHYYDRFDTALAEDIPMLERQQAGLSSPFARQGRYSYLEPSVATFAFWYAQKLLEP